MDEIQAPSVADILDEAALGEVRPFLAVRAADNLIGIQGMEV